MYSFLVKPSKRNNFLYYLKNQGIEASVHFDPPLHRQKYLKKYYKNKLPNTEILAKSLVTLPIYPNLKKNEINKIFKTIKNWYKKNYNK